MLGQKTLGHGHEYFCQYSVLHNKFKLRTISHKVCGYPRQGLRYPLSTLPMAINWPIGGLKLVSGKIFDTKITCFLPEIRRVFHPAPQKETSLSVFKRWCHSPG